jgi:hypothetical protein
VAEELREVLVVPKGDTNAKMSCGCVIERNPDESEEVRMRMCGMHDNAPETTHKLRDILQLAVVMATGQVAKKNDDALITREHFVMRMRAKGADDEAIRNIIRGKVNWMSVWQSLIKTLAKADPAASKMIDKASEDAVDMYMASIEEETGEPISPELKEEALRDGPAAIRAEVLREAEDPETCDCNMCRMFRGEISAEDDEEEKPF